MSGNGKRFTHEELFKLQLYDAIYRLRSYPNSLIHNLSLSNSHNNVASIQKNRGDKSHRVIIALEVHSLSSDQVFLSIPLKTFSKFSGWTFKFFFCFSL